MIHLSEAISSGNRKIKEFPKHPDADEIVQFLKLHGFTEFNKNNTDSSLMNASSKNEPKYNLGLYWEDNPRTHWISFSDGQRRYFCRTCKESYRDSFRCKMDPSRYAREDTYGTYDDFRDSVIQYFDW